MPDIVKIAQAAYAAYGESTDNKNFQGDEMPTWEDLPSAIKRAWMAAVEAILDF